ncbi:MAG: 2-succinyl-5-enolpyruvyl-6-hydroxy-3-cyclohexene-1-carboxylic-acid synthase [Deltaproteobacteria bacterium]|nr:2-succinyl-5-enolpyruvyl-6-hydroxy-3-cyclohexene-1-carboxylic-acid synthase [Deltaproteobacteria bacterium]
MSGGAPARLHAEALVRALVSAGVRDAVLAPGSRNAPLVLALERLVREASVLRLHTVLDERAAAFFALGLARVTGAPTIFCCTSGSAGAHALPAVIEADRSALPLLVLTADRPPELQGVGAPQTVIQQGMFAPYVRLWADPGAPSGEVGPRHLASLAARCVDASVGACPGPVHLNLPYREPLELGDPPAPAGGHRTAPRLSRGPLALDPAEIEELAAQLVAAPRGVLVAGPQDAPAAGRGLAVAHRALGEALCELADALGWPLLADGASTPRGLGRASSAVVSTADALCRTAAFEALAPGLVLRFGQVPTSRAVTGWLARATETWLVDPHGRLQDPDHLASRLLVAEPAALARVLAAAVARTGHSPQLAWQTRWSRADRSARAALTLETGAATPPWSGSVAAALMAALPEGALLHVASSLSIRALDAFAPAPGRRVTVTANRGANGIDGTLATALGQASRWTEGPVAVLLGDLAFLHDLGALLVTPRPSAAVTVVIADNGGGGIFDHLPIARHPTAFEPHFVTPPCVDLGSVVSGLPVTSERADSTAALSAALARHLETPGLSLIHVPIDRAHDLARHQAARAAVERSLRHP